MRSFDMGLRWSYQEEHRERMFIMFAKLSFDSERLFSTFLNLIDLFCRVFLKFVVHLYFLYIRYISRFRKHLFLIPISYWSLTLLVCCYSLLQLYHTYSFTCDTNA
jgi:hypothetical protein